MPVTGLTWCMHSDINRAGSSSRYRLEFCLETTVMVCHGAEEEDQLVEHLIQESLTKALKYSTRLKLQLRGVKS